MLSRLWQVQPVRTLAVLTAIGGIVQAVWLGTHGGGWPSADEWLGLGTALGTAGVSWWGVWRAVTPVARPQDANGNPLHGPMVGVDADVQRRAGDI